MERYDAIVSAATAMARHAGEEVMKYFRAADLQVDIKLNQADIVTEADKAAERVLLDTIASEFPDHAVLSEESGESGQRGEWRWVIDPLDGTTNFAQGLRQFAISIGIEHNGATVVGVVYAPALGELFCAIRGGGAYLNGKRIAVSQKTRLDQAVVSTGFPVDRATNPVNNYDNALRVLPHVRGLRRLGSAAMDLCYTAAGFIDAYWEMNLHLWDVSAGILIAREAGATVEQFRDDRNISILAASPKIFEDLRPLIS